MNHPAALRGARARPWASLALASLLALMAAGTARADITGTVTNTIGVPLTDARVEVRDAAGSFVDSEYTNAAGQYTITTSAIGSSSVAPFTLKATLTDTCRDFSAKEAPAGPVADGAPGVPSVANLVLDVLDFCAPSYTPSGAPDPTGIVDTLGRRLIVPPGGLVYLRVVALPSDAANLQVQLADGTAIGGSASDASAIAVTAPAAGYDGPVNLFFTSGGVLLSRGLGTLTSRAITPPLPLPGPIDIEAIVDLSGSMTGTDPTNVRKDAVNLLLDLARPLDRTGAVGFSSDFKAIFDSTVITGAASVVNSLKAAANRAIDSSGGTDYNIGMDKAYEALTGPGVDPNRQKAIIFLTDGAHGGPYLNGHLRFAVNASGRPWPVCAIQLGNPTSFQPADVARLKRIAAETGGQYFATTTAAQLPDIYFRCFGRTTGQKTLQSKVFTYTAGQQRSFKQKLAGGLPSATFFVGWGAGRYQLQLVDPKGNAHTRAKPGKGFSFHGGASFGFFKVNKPRAGLWRLRVQALKLTVARDRARTTITIPPRR
jgi:VWA domain-containing protein